MIFAEPEKKTQLVIRNIGDTVIKPFDETGIDPVYATGVFCC
jgi:hypothetical protein